AEFPAVVHGCYVIPRAQRMERRPIHQRLARRSRLVVAIEEPAVAGDADFEEHTVVRVRAGRGIPLAQMKPALLPLSTVGPKDRLPRELLGAGERMVVDEQRIIDAVELDGLADG